LFFVARRGRISKAKAIFGTFAGVRPMGDYSADGYTNVLAKAKGAKKAMLATIEYVKKTIIDPEDQYIMIAHSDREEQAMQYKELIEKEIKCKKVFLSGIYMGCAPNIGPGMISVNYLGAPIMEDTSREEL
ncbi:MAG: DegV family protein, partial [Clostridia bacterium]|nr:DegV family protein [Clostridia bacterium]